MRGCVVSLSTRPVYFVMRTRIVGIGYPYSPDPEISYGCEDGRVYPGRVDDSGFWCPLPDSDGISNKELLEMETVDGLPCAMEINEPFYEVFESKEQAERWIKSGSVRRPEDCFVRQACLCESSAQVEAADLAKKIHTALRIRRFEYDRLEATGMKFSEEIDELEEITGWFETGGWVAEELGAL